MRSQTAQRIELGLRAQGSPIGEGKWKSHKASFKPFPGASLAVVGPRLAQSTLDVVCSCSSEPNPITGWRCATRAQRPPHKAVGNAIFAPIKLVQPDTAGRR